MLQRTPVRRLDLLRLLCLCLPLIVMPVQAAVVLLQNGDRLTGQIIAFDGGILRIQTDYAGMLDIDWGQVHLLETEQALSVLTKEDRLLQGRITASPDEGFEIETAEGEIITADQDTIASINPEDWRIGRAKYRTGQFNVAAKLERGNKDTDELDIDIDATVRRKDDRLQVFGALEYDTSRGQRTKNRWDILGKYDYFVDKKLYYSGSLFAEKDEFKGIDSRYRIGPAVGYQFFEGPKKNLKAEVGAYYTTSDIDMTGTTSSPAIGWLIDGDYRFDNTSATAYHRQTMTLANSQNQNFRSRTGVRVPVFASILASAEVEANWDDELPDKTDSTELIYRLKLGYGW